MFGVIEKSYTIQLYIRITNFNKFYARIIDFSNGKENNGIYFTNYYTPPPAEERCLNFYSTGNFGTCPFFNDKTYYLISFTRNNLTKAFASELQQYSLIKAWHKTPRTINFGK